MILAATDGVLLAAAPVRFRHQLGEAYAATGLTEGMVLSVMSQAGLVLLFAVAIAVAGAALARVRSRG